MEPSDIGQRLASPVGKAFMSASRKETAATGWFPAGWSPRVTQEGPWKRTVRGGYSHCGGVLTQFPVLVGRLSDDALMRQHDTAKTAIRQSLESIDGARVTPSTAYSGGSFWYFSFQYSIDTFHGLLEVWIVCGFEGTAAFIARLWEETRD